MYTVSSTRLRLHLKLIKKYMGYQPIFLVLDQKLTDIPTFPLSPLGAFFSQFIFFTPGHIKSTKSELFTDLFSPFKALFLNCSPTAFHHSTFKVCGNTLSSIAIESNFIFFKFIYKSLKITWKKVNKMNNKNFWKQEQTFPKSAQ